MTVRELYKKLAARLPDSLAEEWDNDGLMVCPDADAPVRRVLLALDVTETVVDFAIENRFDLAHQIEHVLAARVAHGGCARWPQGDKAYQKRHRRDLLPHPRRSRRRRCKRRACRPSGAFGG